MEISQTQCEDIFHVEQVIGKMKDKPNKSERKITLFFMANRLSVQRIQILKHYFDF